MLRALITVFSLALVSAAGAQAPSQSLGYPWDGRLVGGVQLAAQGERFFTWDSVRRRSPNRTWRRYGNERLLRTLTRVLTAHTAAFPAGSRIGVGDLSRPGGGDFGAGSAASGTRRTRAGSTPTSTTLAATAVSDRRHVQRRSTGRSPRTWSTASSPPAPRKYSSGRTLDLRGPPAVVEVLPAYHDNHMHVRLPGDGWRPALVGRSTREQPIRAFASGRGRPDVLVFGTIHGNELAGIAVASRLVQTQAPTGATFWVVPDLNPDGHATTTRWNAQGVDLNRNFPGSWRESRRAGAAPASEAETRVAMRLIRRLHPRVTIWFHQPQGLVRATGRSIGIARRYARLAGMRFRRLPRPPGSANRVAAPDASPARVGSSSSCRPARWAYATRAATSTPCSHSPTRLRLR